MGTIIKGNARGGARDLARHLERTGLQSNEHAELVEVKGVAADRLDGALREMEAIGIGAETKRFCYHASISPDPAEPAWTEKQRDRAIAMLEKELGFEGQARAVVAHVKKDRQGRDRAHWHVVWSRIDLDRMAGISDSHNFRKHELVARAIEREFGLKRLQGAHVEREGVERPERTPSHAEMQQAERTDLSPKEAKAALTAIWNRTDSGKAFAAALEDQGWILARGDRRDFVVVDRAGEVHSLARRIEGTKAADVRARMADLDREKLPSTAEAKDIQQDRSRGVVPDHDRMQWEDKLATAAIAKAEQEREPPATPATEAAQEKQAAPATPAKGDKEQEASAGTGGDSILSVGIDMLSTLITESIYIVKETAKEARYIGGELASESMALGAFVAAELDRRAPEPPPRTLRPADYALDPEARRVHHAQQAADRQRAAALDRIAESVRAGESLSAADVRALSRADLENLKDKGDDALRQAIADREKERARER